MNILITGAAQGIGAAIATLAAKKGHTVGIYDINQEKLTQLADRLNKNTPKKLKKQLKKQSGVQVISGKLDVTNAADWDTALAEFTNFAGGLDVLVNNAGVLSSGKFTNIPLEKHLAQLEVNNKGTLMGCYKAKPLLPAHDNAKVINLSSGSSLFGQPDLASYAATKFFVRGLTEGLDVEWSADGVRCLSIIPFFVATDMVTGMKTGSIEKFGVHTTAADVAKTVLKAAELPNKKVKQTHHPVGLTMKVLRRVTQLLPDSINWKIHEDMLKKDS